MKKQMKLLLLISLLSFVLAGCEDTANTAGGTSSPDVTVSSSQKAGFDSDSTNSNVDNNVPDAKSSVDSTDDNNSANQNPDANEVDSNDASVGDSSVKSEAGNNSGTVNSGTGNLTSNNTGSSDGNKENSSAVSSGDSQTQIDSQTKSESDTNAAGEENQSAHEDRSQQSVSYKDLVIGEVAEGNIVTFGHYEQDNNFDNGAEPIEWRVLEVNDGKATLIPVKALIGSDRDHVYDTLDEFASAFSESEQAIMLEGPSLFTQTSLKRLWDKHNTQGQIGFRPIDKTFLAEPTAYCSAYYKATAAKRSACYIYCYYFEGGTYQYQLEYDHNHAGSFGYDTASIHDFWYKDYVSMICPYIVINVEEE